MTSSTNLQSLESDAYRASFDDGIIDLFVGLSMVWIGSAWIWLTDLAGVAGVFPAVMAPALLPLRTRIVESRTGYVKWRAPRRCWEQRTLLLVLAAGILMFALGIAAFVMLENSGELTVVEWIMPGLLALLMAVVAGGLAIAMAQPRMMVYAGVLVVAGLAAAGFETNPGWPLLAAGIAITVVGSGMLVRYLRTHPLVTAP
ncbi:MAG TPA: hypothetical protein VLG28_09145 [Acidimicrobiia bacterium]|jgi:hypothetical protein|nr:hypothetical protein [Acidimicrobiia bacterium]